MPSRSLVFVIDDHEDSRDTYALYLSSAGFEVLALENAEEALRLAQRLRPAVVVVDVRLPGASGFDLTRRLRVDDRTRNAAILILTGDGLARERSAAVDADCFLLKPFPPEALVVQIVAALAERAHKLDQPQRICNARPN